jgi:hypothetical protein
MSRLRIHRLARDPLGRAATALLAVNVLGAVVAASTHLSSLVDALGRGSKLSTPGPLLAVQVAAAAVAVAGPGRRTATAGATVLATACSLSLAACAFDGDIGHAGLSASQVAYQVVEVAAIATVWAMALARLVRAVRGRREVVAA